MAEPDATPSPITVEPPPTASEVDVVLDLDAPCPLVRLLIRGRTAGRAEAEVAGRSWSAKHFWREGPASREITLFEFDEPLPAGRVVLHIPLVRSAAG